MGILRIFSFSAEKKNQGSFLSIIKTVNLFICRINVRNAILKNLVDVNADNCT